jgi:hypothetical protein
MESNDTLMNKEWISFIQYCKGVIYAYIELNPVILNRSDGLLRDYYDPGVMSLCKMTLTQKGGI